MTNDPDATELPSALVLAFAPVHKRDFGIACGSALATLVAALTLVHLVRSPDDPYPLSLLAAYFSGYTVSLSGVFIGAAWAGVSGFVAGWFLAFTRNLVIAISIFLVRTRATLAANRDFLDHI
jgi:hypothetical protein